MPADRSLRLDPETSVVVFVDMQERLLPAIYDDAAVQQRARLLGFGAEQAGVPIIATQQNPDGLGPVVPPFSEACAELLTKEHFGAVEDGLLEAVDRVAPGATQIVIAGVEAHVTVLQTALGVLESGRQAWVVTDACGSRDVRDFHATKTRLKQVGAALVSSEMVVFEWMQTYRHPHFKALSRAIREPRFPSPED